MSVDRETIADVCGVNPEAVSCRQCKYGGGAFLVECGLWGRIMGPSEFCSLWNGPGEDKETKHGDRVRSSGSAER